MRGFIFPLCTLMKSVNVLKRGRGNVSLDNIKKTALKRSGTLSSQVSCLLIEI